MKIGKVRDNSGVEHNYIKGLKVGDKIISINTKSSRGDIGMSGQTYRYEMFIVGKEYEVESVGGAFARDLAWVIDKDGCSTWVEPEFFRLCLSEERNMKLEELGI